MLAGYTADAAAAAPSKPGLVPWCVQLRCDLYQLGLAERWQQPECVSELSADAWRTVARRAVTTREQARRWREVNVPSCSAAPVYAAVHSPDAPMRCASYLGVQHGGWKDRMLTARQLLTRLRCGSHRLRVVTGRWEGDAPCFQLCPLCATATESVQHFLLDCSHLQTERMRLFAQIDAIVQEAQRREGLPSSFQLQELTSGEQLRLLLGDGLPSVSTVGMTPTVQTCALLGALQFDQERTRALAAAAEVMQL